MAEEQNLAPEPINFRPLHYEQMLRSKQREEFQQENYYATLRTFCGDEKYCSKADLQQLQRGILFFFLHILFASVLLP